ncbi:hypothetical protein A2U01_0031137, partial [Trifolium medium]|nr:hypothetical protein [Trifolium medium]
HLPFQLVRKVIKKRTRVYITSMMNLHNYGAKIKTASRDPFEKYIGRAWYRFLDDHNPRVGDLLVFNMYHPSDYINVKLIRERDRRDNYHQKLNRRYP